MTTNLCTRKWRAIICAVVPATLAASWGYFVWHFPYTLSMDSPSHLYTSHVTSDLFFRPDSPFSKYYELNSVYLPNWGTTLVLNFFGLIGGKAAEHLVKIVLPLFFAFALWTVLHRRSSNPILLLPLLYPLVFSFFLSAGFYGFYIGTALMICLFPSMLRHPADIRTGKAVLISLLLIVTYYFHVFAFVLSALLISCSVAIDSVLDARSIQVGKATSQNIRKVFYQGLTCALWGSRRIWLAILPPVLLLLMHFRADDSLGKGVNAFGFGQARIRIAEALAFEGGFNFIAWNPFLKIFTIVLILSLFTFGLGKTCAPSKAAWRRDHLKILCFIGCVSLLFLLCPDQTAEGGYITARLLYSIFILMVLFAALHLTQREACIFSVIAILPFAYFHQRSLYRDSQMLQPYIFQLLDTSRRIAPYSAILFLAYDTNKPTFEAFTSLQDGLRHIGGYLALNTKSVLLNNYEGIVNTFPLRLRPSLKSQSIKELKDEFAPFRLRALNSLLAQDGDIVDFVVLWETDHGTVDENDKSRVRRLLSSRLRLVYESHSPVPLYLYAR